MKNKSYLKLVFAALITFLCSIITYAQPPGSGWNKVFEDNFRGSSLDMNKWIVRTHSIYTTNNYSVGGDLLRITSDFPNSGNPRGARIDSKATFGGNDKYGYYEARIRIKGSATGDVWPTWWLWGGNYRNGGPAPSATEIDIMEYSGFANRWFNNKATSSHHYFDQRKINGKSDITTTAANAANRNAFAWHTWAVLWTPTEITFYYDGQPYMSSDQPGNAAADVVPTRMILSSGPHTAGVAGFNRSANNGSGQPDHPIPANAAKRGDNLAVFEIDWVRKWTGGTVTPSGPNAQYDFGTSNSPLQSGYTRITQSSSNWTNNSGLNSRSRGAGPNNLNRDFVFSSQAKTFEHTLPNGTYDVTVTFGDRDYARTGQAVKAEGQTKASNVNTSANQFVNRSFQTTVNDGKLSLEFSTTTSNNVWCVTRVTIAPSSGGGNNGGSNVNAQLDFGTASSPVFNGYNRITQTSSNWTNTSGLDSRLRGTGPNNINRDFIFSAQTKTFEYNVPNGSYDVTVTFGDRDYARNGQVVKAEGQTKASNINTSVNQFVNRSFQATVNDGKLSLEFSTTSSGVWCVTRVVIKTTGSAKTIGVNKSVSISPNPIASGNILTVNAASTVTSVNILDITGSIVYTGNTNEVSINLASGFYLVQINTTEGTSTEKLLVK